MMIVSNGEITTHNEEILSAIYKIVCHDEVVSHKKNSSPCWRTICFAETRLSWWEPVSFHENCQPWWGYSALPWWRYESTRPLLGLSATMRIRSHYWDCQLWWGYEAITGIVSYDEDTKPLLGLPAMTRTVSHDEDILLLHDEETKPLLWLSAMMRSVSRDVESTLWWVVSLMKMLPWENMNSVKYLDEI